MNVGKNKNIQNSNMKWSNIETDVADGFVPKKN
jgi:hypothetical protein